MADIDEEALSFRGTNDDEADAQGLSSGRSRHVDPWEKGMLIARAVLGMFCFLSILVLMLVSDYASRARDETKFSMHLAGYEGLNATQGHTVSVSPVFNLKVRVENPRVLLQPWCYSGGEVTVSYSDVVLAWGHVPRFCMKTRVPVGLTVVPLGREVGLSEDLRARLASDWRMGTAQIMVDMKLFYEEQKFSSPEYEGPSLHPFQLMLRGGEQLVN
ncbi:unnamed protein product [Urochloa humidicola]